MRLTKLYFARVTWLPGAEQVQEVHCCSFRNRTFQNPKLQMLNLPGFFSFRFSLFSFFPAVFFGQGNACHKSTFALVLRTGVYTSKNFVLPSTTSLSREVSYSLLCRRVSAFFLIAHRSRPFSIPHCSSMLTEGYSVYIGMASTLYCRKA